MATAALACLGAFLPNPARALTFEEQIQGLTVTPFLSERVEYESNVFQTPDKTRSDMIFRTIPGFLADLTRGPFSVSAGYRAEIINYATLTDQNTVNQSGLVQLKADMPRLKLQLRDDFMETTDPPGSELTGPIRTQTNVLAPMAAGMEPVFSMGDDAPPATWHSFAEYLDFLRGLGTSVNVVQFVGHGALGLFMAGDGDPTN